MQSTIQLTIATLHFPRRFDSHDQESLSFWIWSVFFKLINYRVTKKICEAVASLYLVDCENNALGARKVTYKPNGVLSRMSV